MCIFTLTTLLNTAGHCSVDTGGFHKDEDHSAPVQKSSYACGIFDIKLTP